MLKSISHTINRFVSTAINQGLCNERDRIYLSNRICSLVKVKQFSSVAYNQSDQGLLGYMDNLVDYAVSHHIIMNTGQAREQFEAELMNIITPLPSQVNRLFWEKYQANPNLATDYFHALSQATHYLKSREISKDRRFITASKYGQLQITINKSKPEKDPKAIILQKKSQDKPQFPECALCIENEGFEGSLNQAARQNHRLVAVALSEAIFYLQYSPYAYYNEHSIFVSENHQPMAMNRTTFNHILEIVDRFPHYFVGSNAELPIVGGSILSHEHFQGGKHDFPMDEARHFYQTHSVTYPQCEISLLEWPASVIRLRHENPSVLAELASHILTHWQTYNNASIDIIANTNGQPHNTVTTIARKKGDSFEFNIVLRNNRTTETHPNGIFHPHAHLHHVKKENIGLIEVMGLAILPARLEQAMDNIELYLTHQMTREAIPSIHLEWVEYLERKYQDKSELDWSNILQAEIGYIFEEILETVGVFKQNSQGKAAFIRFIESCLISLKC